MTNYATNLVEDLRLLEQPTEVPWLLIACGVVAAVVIGVLLATWLRRKNSGLGILGAEAEEDPSVEALKALNELAALLSTEHSREFAIEVTSIVRVFLEKRFDLRAPQRATEEFLREAAGSSELDPAQRGLLAEFLRTCDAMKFGRAHGEMEELGAAHQAAIRFVEASRGRPVRKEARS